VRCGRARARSVWSAWSLLPLSARPRLTIAPASWTHSKRGALPQCPPSFTSVWLVLQTLRQEILPAYRVFSRCCPGGGPAMPRRVPGADHEVAFICRASRALFASSAVCAAFSFIKGAVSGKSARIGFTPEPASARKAADERKGLIGGEELFVYHPKMGRYADLHNHLFDYCNTISNRIKMCDDGLVSRRCPVGPAQISVQDSSPVTRTRL
jgi:hypothetical protein